MAKILAINTGSSTLKWKLFDMPKEQVIASGMVDRMGMTDSTFKVKYGNGKKYLITQDITTAEIAVDMVLKALLGLKIISTYDEIEGVGHRVVAGGERFTESTLLNESQVNEIERLSDFAPLHNPAEAKGIRAFMHLLPGVPEVGVFDTSFHTTLPKVNYLYSIKPEYYQKYGARKYGAHGTSHRYISSRAAEMLGKPLKDLRMVTMHMGSGVSVACEKDGKSLDTSMGFTPVSGVTMSTRSGDIDPSLVAFLMKKLNITDPEDMIKILNQDSGVKAISELSPDMREIEKTRTTRPQSQLAIDIFVNRIVKYVAGYIAEMGGVDVLVFSGGIGEGDAKMRQRIIDGLAVFGPKLDPVLNDVDTVERVISSKDSPISVLLVPTNEELMIARDVVRLGHLA